MGEIDQAGRASKMVFKGHRQLEHRFCPATTPAISSNRQSHFRANRLILVVLSLWLAGCNNQPPGAHALPAADVTISKAVQKEVVNWNEFTGRTAAVKLVNVTPRVSGYIVDIPFKEGDIVHKGDSGGNSTCERRASLLRKITIRLSPTRANPQRRY